MTKLPNEFNGYINVDEDTFTYSVSNYIVSLLPAESNPVKIEEFLIVSVHATSSCQNIYLVIMAVI